LLIEDDASIRLGLELNLRKEGYHVLTAEDCGEGLRLALAQSPDLILLDLMLPDGSGLDLLKALREKEQEMQVLILTARGLEGDKVKGLGLGADDYITKPFSLEELFARINAALRRERNRKKQPVCFGDFEIDRNNRELWRKGCQIRLTRREYELLNFLVDRPERVFSREQLLQTIWGLDYEGTPRTVDNFIYSLRTKLETDPTSPRHILTVHGVGYRFQR
jgi:DNA-binding response OmpR family regulator